MKTFQCGQVLSGPAYEIQVIDLETARTALEEAKKAGSALMVIKPDGEITVDPEYQGNDLKRLQEAVDGYIEPITLPGQPYRGPYLAYVNEEGLCIGMETNVVASNLFGVQVVGPLAVAVGFCIDQHGNTVPKPINAEEHA